MADYLIHTVLVILSGQYIFLFSYMVMTKPLYSTLKIDLTSDLYRFVIIVFL